MNPSIHLLIIDDEPSVCRVLALAAQQAGHRATWTTDPHEGLELARTAAPDVIALDVRMPGLDGRDVAVRLKRDTTTAHIPVILMTGGAAWLDRRACLELGIEDLEEKPIRPGQFLRKLEHIARGRV